MCFSSIGQKTLGITGILDAAPQNELENKVICIKSTICNEVLKDDFEDCYRFLKFQNTLKV